MSITPPAPDDPFAATRVAAEGGAADPPVTSPVPAAPERARERWPVPLLTLATIAAAVWAIGSVEPPPERATGTAPPVAVSPAPTDDEPVPAPADAETPVPAPGETQPTGSGSGVGDGGSLWKPDNLRAALRSMRAKAGGAEKISSLRVDTDYLVAEYMKGKRRISVYANRDGRVDAQGDRIGSPTDAGVPVSRVNSKVPDRVARRIAAIARVSQQHVDYLVLRQLPGASAQWIGFIDQESDYDRQLNPFFANLDGSGVRANGPKARR